MHLSFPFLILSFGEKPYSICASPDFCNPASNTDYGRHTYLIRLATFQNLTIG